MWPPQGVPQHERRGAHRRHRAERARPDRGGGAHARGAQRRRRAGRAALQRGGLRRKGSFLKLNEGSWEGDTWTCSNTGLCKRNVSCLKIPAPSAAKQSDLPMYSPINQFQKVH